MLEKKENRGVGRPPLHDVNRTTTPNGAQRIQTNETSSTISQHSPHSVSDEAFGLLLENQSTTITEVSSYI